MTEKPNVVWSEESTEGFLVEAYFRPGNQFRNDSFYLKARKPNLSVLYSDDICASIEEDGSSTFYFAKLDDGQIDFDSREDAARFARLIGRLHDYAETLWTAKKAGAL